MSGDVLCLIGLIGGGLFAVIRGIPRLDHEFDICQDDCPICAKPKPLPKARVVRR